MDEQLVVDYCVYCSGDIKGIKVTYKGKIYHKDCFDLMFPDMKEEDIYQAMERGGING